MHFFYIKVYMVLIYALVSGQLVLYIGKTKNLSRREGQHRCKSNDCSSKDIPEYIDWTITLLETVSDNQAFIKEQYYFDTLKPLYNSNKPIQSSIASKEYSKKYYYSKGKNLRKLKSNSDCKSLRS